MAAVVLAVAIPIALNIYTPGWNDFLKGLPVLGESVTLARWFVLFILLAVFGAALAVDRLARSSMVAAAIFLVVAVATVWWHAAEPSQVSRGYHSAPIEGAWHEAAAMGVRPITEVKGKVQSSAVPTYIDRNNAMVDGGSEIFCYQPMFGYQLEDFPRKDLQAGPILTPTAGGRLNLKDPSCYLFPKENRCAPGDQFRADQETAMLQFAAYRAFPFQRSTVQTVADWTNLIALIASLLAVVGALVWRPRKTG